MSNSIPRAREFSFHVRGKYVSAHYPGDPPLSFPILAPERRRAVVQAQSPGITCPGLLAQSERNLPADCGRRDAIEKIASEREVRGSVRRFHDAPKARGAAVIDVNYVTELSFTLVHFADK